MGDVGILPLEVSQRQQFVCGLLARDAAGGLYLLGVRQSLPEALQTFSIQNIKGKV